MASDAFNVSPYLCSAINPSAKYLTEFFEALDPAERLETDTLGRSIAFYAAVSETSDCLKFIEANGINLSLVDKYKMSPLIQAARYGRSHNVELLIKHLRGGPEVTTTSPIIFQTLNRNRRTALHYAAYFGHAETCRLLINYGAPVESIENLDKQTPLIYAAKNGYVDCVRVLVEEGKSNPEKGDKFSRTPLHYACINGHIEVVKYLLSFGVDTNASDSSSNTPAHFAAAFGYIKILHLLIVYGSADPSVSNVWRSTPCSVANMKGHIAIVKYLLNLPNTSIDVNFKDQEGCVMLQNNINESVDTPLDMKANIEKISLLLSMKADVNSVDLEGNYQLYFNNSLNFFC
jgi:ankyrin repeat protein